MDTVDLTTLKTRPGEVLDRAKTAAVTVERYGKPAAVIISPEAYAHFEKLEDAFWATKIESRRSKGRHLSNDESLAAMKKLMVR